MLPLLNKVDHQPNDDDDDDDDDDVILSFVYAMICYYFDYLFVLFFLNLTETYDV